jgi:predicted XRE-type DNA-binding protein
MSANRARRNGRIPRHVTADAETDTSVRTALASRLNQLLDARGLSQAEAGQLLGMPQPKISAIRNLKLTGISLERILQALAALGQHVDIVIAPSRKGLPAGIRVGHHTARTQPSPKGLNRSE